MTWAALVLMLVLMAFLGWNVTVWNRARIPPRGVTVSQATVEGTTDPSRPRPGTPNRNFLVLQFQLADGEEGEAAYEECFSGLGIFALLLMVFGWFKVRREPKLGPLNDVPVRRDGPDGICCNRRSTTPGGFENHR